MALHTKQQLLQFFLVILIAATAASQTKPHCPSSCGNLRIDYPFGTSKGCSLDDSFFINCTHTKNLSIPVPLLGQSNITVLDISLQDGQLLVSSPVARACYSNNGSLRTTDGERILDLTMPANFYISPSRNKFTALGCNTIGSFLSSNTLSACVSTCDGENDINSNGSCSGHGCCQTYITEGVSGFEIETDSVVNHSRVHEFNQCGYAFVVEKEAYNFSSKDLKNFENETVPMVLDWGVGDHTCEEAQRNNKSYACKAEHSECHNSTNGAGYRCKCLTGFTGNPYVHGGCVDIDECHMDPSPCNSSARCQNSPGSYNCSCPKGYEGDGMRNGTGCHPKGKSKGNLVLIIALSVSLSLLALLLGSIYLYYTLQKRKLNKTRKIYFQQNGGILLLQRIAKYQGSAERSTIFTTQEVKKATNNFDEVRVIGKGGHGIVYKGVLSDGRVVVIKKAKISNQKEIEQFINEMVVLSQINHKNVVKLLGCCLETEVPLLVYEFITNGTLSDHIHVEGHASQLSWSIRLRVAIETAEALAYLHSATSTPIIHRDVKTANILLDDNLSAKVSDFGASKLVPMDQSQLTTLLQGTWGYLDPEYFQTNKLTDKSDIYSFGVILAELLTSMKAISFVRPESDRNLSMYFVSSIKGGRLPQILDDNIVNNANVEQMIEVANLARRCLKLKGEETPTMKEVAMDLERKRIVEKQSSRATNVCGEETKYSLKVSTSPDVADSGNGRTGSRSIVIGLNSMQNQILEELGD